MITLEILAARLEASRKLAEEEGSAVAYGFLESAVTKFINDHSI